MSSARDLSATIFPLDRHARSVAERKMERKRKYAGSVTTRSPAATPAPLPCPDCRPPAATAPDALPAVSCRLACRSATTRNVPSTSVFAPARILARHTPEYESTFRAATAEHKQAAGKRIGLQFLLTQLRQRIDALASIDGLDRHQNPHLRRNLDQRLTWFSAPTPPDPEPPDPAPPIPFH